MSNGRSFIQVVAAATILCRVGDDLGHVVVRGIGIDNDPEVTAGLFEAGFLEISDLNGRINQAVIVGGVQLFDRGRCQGRGNAPSGRNVAEVDGAEA